MRLATIKYGADTLANHVNIDNSLLEKAAKLANIDNQSHDNADGYSERLPMPVGVCNPD
jgi:hypothetical protein